MARPELGNNKKKYTSVRLDRKMFILASLLADREIRPTSQQIEYSILEQARLKDPSLIDKANEMFEDEKQQGQE